MQKTLLEFFDGLPAAEREEVFRLLKAALMFRGGGFGFNSSMRSNLENLAEVLSRNGREIEEYT